MTIGTPCQPWPVDLSCTDLPETISQQEVDRWSMVATEVLWALSGRRWGPCPVTVRPCRRSCLIDWMGRIDWPGQTGLLVPYQIDGVWRNLSLCGCGAARSCGCGELCEVILEGPVHDVLEVKVNGAIIDPDDYRLDQPGSLVRQNGDCWPICQNLNLDGDQDGTFEVTYNVGLALGQGAIAAVSELTGELVKNCNPDCGECRLPRRVTQIVRQGVAAQFIDPMQFLEQGRTGLYLVDLWLAAVNPQHSATPGRVLSPDWPASRVIG